MPDNILGWVLEKKVDQMCLKHHMECTGPRVSPRILTSCPPLPCIREACLPSAGTKKDGTLFSLLELTGEGGVAELNPNPIRKRGAALSSKCHWDKVTFLSSTEGLTERAVVPREAQKVVTSCPASTAMPPPALTTATCLVSCLWAQQEKKALFATWVYWSNSTSCP